MRCPRAFTTGCSMFSWPGATAAWKDARSLHADAGQRAQAEDGHERGPAQQQQTCTFSVMTTAFSPPSAV